MIILILSLPFYPPNNQCSSEVFDREESYVRICVVYLTFSLTETAAVQQQQQQQLVCKLKRRRRIATGDISGQLCVLPCPSVIANQSLVSSVTLSNTVRVITPYACQAGQRALNEQYGNKLVETFCSLRCLCLASTTLIKPTHPAHSSSAMPC